MDIINDFKPISKMEFFRFSEMKLSLCIFKIIIMDCQKLHGQCCQLKFTYIKNRNMCQTRISAKTNNISTTLLITYIKRKPCFKQSDVRLPHGVLINYYLICKVNNNNSVICFSVRNSLPILGGFTVI